MAPQGGRMYVDPVRLGAAATAAESIAVGLPTTPDTAEADFRAAIDAHHGTLGAIALAQAMRSWRAKLTTLGQTVNGIGGNLRASIVTTQEADRSNEEQFGGPNVPV